jgi:hypothetical protein
MPTLYNEAQRKKQIARLQNLKPGSKPAWGKLTSHNLLPHLADPILVALGDYKVELNDAKFFKTKFGKWLIIYGIPRWPKSAPTAPEFDITRYGRKGNDFEKDKKDLFEIIERFGNAKEPSLVPPHPVFGKISWKTWGYLMNKHIEHHCRQFGL